MTYLAAGPSQARRDATRSHHQVELAAYIKAQRVSHDTIDTLSGMLPSPGDLNQLKVSSTEVEGCIRQHENVRDGIIGMLDFERYERFIEVLEAAQRGLEALECVPANILDSSPGGRARYAMSR